MNWKLKPTSEISEDPTWYRTKSLTKTRALMALLYYFLGHVLLIPMIWAILISILYDVQKATIYAQAVSDFFNLFVFLIVFLPFLEESFEVFRKNVSYTLVHSLKWYIPQLLTNAVIGAIILALTGRAISGNQTAVEQLYGQSFLAIAIPAIVVAPMVEELIFRGVIFRSFRRFGFLPAALISSISFGLLHVVLSMLGGDYADLIFILTYGVMAFFFCLAYEKTRNIYGCYFLHLLNNIIAIAALGISGVIL